MPQKRLPNKVAQLFGYSALLIGCWTIVLPALSERPAIRRQLDLQNERGINAGAMFYSELKAMPRVLERMDQIHAEHGNAFWQCSAATSRP